MKAYIFQAALWCAHCAERYKAENAKPSHVDEDNESSYDSDDWPKGPYGDGGGEADCPQHCDACGVFLENALTPDGDKWLRQEAEPFAAPDASWDETAQAAEAAGQPVLADWLRYYYAPGQ